MSVKKRFIPLLALAAVTCAVAMYIRGNKKFSTVRWKIMDADLFGDKK